MRINDYYNILELIKQDIISSEDEYLKLLKVVGNNQRYDFLSTVLLKENKEYLDGFITNSTIIPFYNERQLKNTLENLSYKKEEKNHDELEKIATQIDEIVYHNDYYEYADSVGISEEEREQNRNEIYKDLENHETKAYIDTLEELREESEDQEEIKNVINDLENLDKKEVKNYKIEEERYIEKLTPSERLNNNLEAISMLKRIESGERELDITAQDTLSKYVG